MSQPTSHKAELGVADFDLQPGFAWRRHLPLIAVVLSTLLLLVGATAWWVRRLSVAFLDGVK